MTIRVATSDEEIARCFAVMGQLRRHLERDDFVARIRRQQSQGYRLAYVEADGRSVAVAGYRISKKLSSGRFLFVDALVTDEGERSKGLGARLLMWLQEEEAAAGCDSLQLDTGIQRKDAQRFYSAKGCGWCRIATRFPRSDSVLSPGLSAVSGDNRIDALGGLRLAFHPLTTITRVPRVVREVSPRKYNTRARSRAACWEPSETGVIGRSRFSIVQERLGASGLPSLCSRFAVLTRPARYRPSHLPELPCLRGGESRGARAKISSQYLHVRALGRFGTIGFNEPIAIHRNFSFLWGVGTRHRLGEDRGVRALGMRREGARILRNHSTQP